MSKKNKNVSTKNINNNKKTINKRDNSKIFQVTAWDAGDYLSDETDELEYKIHMFGTLENGKKIFVQVNNFKPYFFLNVPMRWNKIKAEQFKNYLNQNMKSATIVDIKILKRERFYGYNGGKKLKFVKLIFNSYSDMKKLRNLFTYREETKKNKYYFTFKKIKFDGGKNKYTIYEGGLDPMLRFMHVQDIQASGWIKINNYTKLDEKISNNHYDVECDYTQVKPFKKTGNAKLLIAAFDIECYSYNGEFPKATIKENVVYQIGTTYNYLGEAECCHKQIICYGSCDDIEGVEVIVCKSEKELLLRWAKEIRKYNPDFIVGYNTFGFDNRYLHDRAKLLGIAARFARLCRIKNLSAEFEKKELCSAGLGDNELYYYVLKGRIQIDVMKIIQKGHKLTSYSLDNVASTFIRSSVKDAIINEEEGTSVLLTENLSQLRKDRYICIYYNIGLTDNFYKDKKKFHVLDVNKVTHKGKEYYAIKIDGIIDGDAIDFANKKIFWCQVKDDVTANDIFRMYKGTSADRTIIAKYCVQDCELCNIILEKLKIITNMIGMSSVTSVPFEYLVLRGQGIKTYSLISKECREMKLMIKNLPKIEEKIEYDGAIVLFPKPGIYDEPIVVLDFNSLYPNSIIQFNGSHETHITDEKYKGMEGLSCNKVCYRNNKGEKIECSFARPKEGGQIGAIPRILQKLLQSRKDVRVEQKNYPPGSEEHAVYEGLQLAYKISCNSVYGYIGAKTSKIFNLDIASATTAVGRTMIKKAKLFVEKVFTLIVEAALTDKDLYLKYVNELLDTNSITREGGKKIPMYAGYPCNTKYFKLKDKCNNRGEFIEYYYHALREWATGYKITPTCIYGDTDSIFVNLQMRDAKTNIRPGEYEYLKKGILGGVLISELISCILPYPQHLEYEKTLYPFIIHTKKRYVGNLYENDPDKYYQKSMGIVLKRRDNAQIVKEVVGGIVNCILIDKDKGAAIKFTQKILSDIMKGKYPIDKFIVSKTLRSNYKHRERIPHAVLADRIKERGGDVPNINDRVQYVFRELNYKPKIQGERVETPDYVIENNLKIDYLYYITNQIKKPAIQFLSYITKNPEKMFDRMVMIETNRRKGAKPISYWMKKQKL